MASRAASPAGSPVRTWLALLAAGALVLGGCRTAPTATATASGPNATGAPPSSTAGASPSGGVAAELAGALRDAIDIEDMLAGLDRLQAIAEEHDGNRAAGTDGHQASADYVAEELRQAGYRVELLPVDLPVFLQEAPSVLEIDVPGAPAFEDLRDFKAMTYSASGDVAAKVVTLGFDPNAKPGDRNGLGCAAADWTGAQAGSVVLLQPGPCLRRDAVVNAQNAGVVAVVTSYADWARDGVLRPTLLEPEDIRIPAIGTTHAVGLALAEAASRGGTARVATHTVAERRTSLNVVAETPGGDPSNILMLGSHLDSVIDGPGINDNGSGTMLVLEIARELALAAANPGTRPAWKVRVAFWTGEELGLFGSAAYAQALGVQRDGPIRAYLNFDMVGSPNGIRAVYDGAVSSRPGPGAAITGLFTTALDAAGLGWELEQVGAASDHYPLEQAAIPVGGLYSGANELKTVAQATTFGGTAGTMDACYHLGCDIRANVDPVLLEQLARAAAWVTGQLASGAVTLPPS